jgi:hypothetical protein
MNLLNDSYPVGTVRCVVGEIVRIAAPVGPSTIGKLEKAQSDTLANLAGVVGVVQSGSVAGGTNTCQVISDGTASALLETGLTPAAGDMLWISGTVAGRLTNVKPAIPFAVGTIKSVGRYSNTATINQTALLAVSVSVNSLATAFQDAQAAAGGGSGALAYGFFTHTGSHATIAIDAPFPFDVDGPIHGGVARLAPGNEFEFVLPAIGVYDISWQMSVNEPGQTMLDLNDGAGYVLQLQTMAGRATGTSQITNRVLIATTTVNATIKIMNHSAPATMTLTPLPGGTSAGTTSLAIVRIA